jgi:hypothetical protein
LELLKNFDGIASFTESMSEEEIQKEIDEQSDLDDRY